MAQFRRFRVYGFSEQSVNLGLDGTTYLTRFLYLEEQILGDLLVNGLP